MGILEDAAGIVAEYDKMSVLSSIAKALEESPDGDWLFILTNAPIGEADGVFINSNVGPMEGLSMADVYKHVTLSQLWNPVEDIDEGEPEE